MPGLQDERRRTARQAGRPFGRQRGRTKVEQRQHTRYQQDLPVRIFRRGDYDGEEMMFEASVGSIDISAGGVFLRSTFFLKLGMELELEIELPDMDRRVHLSGEVARVISTGQHGDTGFAIRFTEFHADAEVFLRAYLTQGDMIAFVEQHAKKILPTLPKHNLPKLVELIVSWQIYQEELRRG